MSFFGGKVFNSNLTWNFFCVSFLWFQIEKLNAKFSTETSGEVNRAWEGCVLIINCLQSCSSTLGPFRRSTIRRLMSPKSVRRQWLAQHTPSSLRTLTGLASACCKSKTIGQMDLKVGVHEFLIFPNSPRWQRAMKSLRNPKLPISNSV